MLPEELIIQYLEMFQPPAGEPRSAPAGSSVLRVERPQLDFYRFLYAGVGAEWHWTDRLVMADDTLQALITAPGVEIHVLYWNGAPAGYVEFELDTPGEAKIAYFGLLPFAIGHGLGGFFLDWAVRYAFQTGAHRLWLHTCNLDHPGALPNYLKAGFCAYQVKSQPNPYRAGARCLGLRLGASHPASLAYFYHQALGARPLDFKGFQRNLQLDGLRLEIVQEPEPSPKDLIFRALDLEALVERATERGARRISKHLLHDPEGHRIHLS
jgi:GNAT superfamily N-acetyltransferase